MNFPDDDAGPWCYRCGKQLGHGDGDEGCYECIMAVDRERATAKHPNHDNADQAAICSLCQKEKKSDGR